MNALQMHGRGPLLISRKDDPETWYNTLLRYLEGHGIVDPVGNSKIEIEIIQRLSSERADQETGNLTHVIENSMNTY